MECFAKNFNKIFIYMNFFVYIISRLFIKFILMECFAKNFNKIFINMNFFIYNF